MKKIGLYLFFLWIAATGWAQSEAFYFIQMSDPQLGMWEKNKSFVRETDLMERAVAAVNKLNPAFVVITGDLVNDGKDRKQIGEFKRLCARVRKEIPVYVLPGNHDLCQEAEEPVVKAYIEEYGYDCFSFQLKNCCFIGLNTPVVFAGREERELSQRVWMEKVLENAGKCNHRILFTHYPFFLKSADEPDQYFNIPLKKRGAYLNLFEKYRVDAVFAGHLHYNAWSQSGRLQAVVTGAVCYPLGNDPAGFRIVRVYPDRIESDYYALDAIPEKVEL